MFSFLNNQFTRGSIILIFDSIVISMRMDTEVINILKQADKGQGQGHGSTYAICVHVCVLLAQMTECDGKV